MNDFSFATGETMSRKTYNILIGVILFGGFLVNYIMCQTMSGFFMSWHPIVLIIAYFICALTGCLMSKLSNNPIISLIGYCLVVIPVGAVLSVCLPGVDPTIVKNAILVTVLVTGVMLALSIMKPDVFLSLGKILFWSSLAVIIIEALLCIFKIVTPAIWDMAVAAIFALYIGYDWSKAQKLPATADNAVDSCVELYLDIIILFLRIVSASEKRRKR